MGRRNLKAAASFWADMDRRDWHAVRARFDDAAVIVWHNTGETFSAEEFVRVNAEYPGEWSIGVERLECAGSLAVSVVKVESAGGGASFHAVSFFMFRDVKIARLDEYWGEYAEPPQWRTDMGIGRRVQAGNKP